MGVALGAATPAPAAAPTTSLLSLSSTGAKGDDWSFQAAVSADGRWVAFGSRADNLVSPPSTNAFNVFLRDRKSGETRQVNLVPGGGQPNADAGQPSISDDGRYVAFLSGATNLASSPGSLQAFVYDRSSGQIRRLSTNVTPGGFYDQVIEVSISRDGRKVVFLAWDFLGTATMRADAFVVDVASGSVGRLAESAPGVQGNASVHQPTLSGDGRWAAYSSVASDLVPGDTNGTTDVFVENLETGARERVSVRGDGSQSNGSSTNPSIDASGCAIAFSSTATDMVVGAEVTGTKTFVRDRCEGNTEAASRTNAFVVETSEPGPRVSGDGCSVAYLRGPPATRSMIVRDLCVGLTERIDVSTSGEPANGAVDTSIFNLGGAKGRFAVFASQASNLDGADSGTGLDVFLRDRAAQNTAPKAVVSVTAAGNRVTVDATGSSDPDGYVLSGTIGFGDGSPEVTGLTASHDYTRGATYTVAVTVTDADGVTDRIYQAITVPDAVSPPAGGGPPPTTGGPSDGTPRTALRLSGARLSRSAFAVVPAGGRPGGTRGATLSATLSDASTLSMTFSRRVKGRRSNGRCTANARKGAPCTVYQRVGATTRKLQRGAARIALTGRVGSTTLAPGTYRLELRARAPDGRVSSVVTLAVRIIPAARRR